MKVKRSSNRLYKLIIEGRKPVCLMSKTEEESWLWHCRLGHVNFKAMTLMSEKEMAHGLPKFVQPKEICKGCLMFKQVRNSFPQQTTFNALKILKLVHRDICSPISPSTPGGNRYFFLLVDDYSRFMWAYFLKTKDEAFEAFQKFIAMVEDKPE